LFYPDDFSSDGKVEVMTTEEVGAYTLLLCKSWRENPPGSVPNDDTVLARWARLTLDRWAECRIRVLAAFTLGKDSRWYQPRLRSEFNKLLRARRQKKLQGLKGAQLRWHNHSLAKEGPLPRDSISSSSSISQNLKTPLPPASGGQNQQVFSWCFETIAVEMGRKHRLPNFSHLQGTMASEVVEFLNRKGFKARIVPKQ
jgi:uncharacterized protein YdaU (DUF1376 family)